MPVPRAFRSGVPERLHYVGNLEVWGVRSNACACLLRVQEFGLVSGLLEVLADRNCPCIQASLMGSGSRSSVAIGSLIRSCPGYGQESWNMTVHQHQRLEKR